MRIFLNTCLLSALTVIVSMLSAGCVSIGGTAVKANITDITRGNGRVIITAAAKRNNKYQLQKTDDLLKAEWKNVGLCVTAESNKVFFVDSNVSNREQFYRVVLVP